MTSLLSSRKEKKKENELYNNYNKEIKQNSNYNNFLKEKNSDKDESIYMNKTLNKSRNVIKNFMNLTSSNYTSINDSNSNKKPVVSSSKLLYNSSRLKFFLSSNKKKNKKNEFIELGSIHQSFNSPVKKKKKK
jgi:hypothetical protein